MANGNNQHRNSLLFGVGVALLLFTTIIVLVVYLDRYKVKTRELEDQINSLKGEKVVLQHLVQSSKTNVKMLLCLDDSYGNINLVEYTHEYNETIGNVHFNCWNKTVIQAFNELPGGLQRNNFIQKDND